MTILGPATSGTATEIPEILRKSRRETPELSCLSLGCFRFGSSSPIVPPFHTLEAQWDVSDSDHRRPLCLQGVKGFGLAFKRPRNLCLRKVNWPDEIHQSNSEIIGRDTDSYKSTVC